MFYLFTVADERFDFDYSIKAYFLFSTGVSTVMVLVCGSFTVLS